MVDNVVVTKTISGTAKTVEIQSVSVDWTMDKKIKTINIPRSKNSSDDPLTNILDFKQVEETITLTGKLITTGTGVYSSVTDSSSSASRKGKVDDLRSMARAYGVVTITWSGTVDTPGWSFTAGIKRIKIDEKENLSYYDVTLTLVLGTDR